MNLYMIMLEARKAYQKYLKDNGWLDSNGNALTNREYAKKEIEKGIEEWN